MKIYRKQAVLVLSAMKDKGRAYIEIAPATGEGGGETEVKERFDFDRAVRIAFDPLGMLKVSYRLIGLAHGAFQFLEEANIITVAASTSDKDKVLAARPVGGGFELSLNHGSKTYSVSLGRDDVYAIGMWFQFQAQNAIMRE